MRPKLNTVHSVWQISFLKAGRFSPIHRTEFFQELSNLPILPAIVPQQQLLHHFQSGLLHEKVHLLSICSQNQVHRLGHDLHVVFLYSTYCLFLLFGYIFLELVYYDNRFLFHQFRILWKILNTVS